MIRRGLGVIVGAVLLSACANDGAALNAPGDALLVDAQVVGDAAVGPDAGCTWPMAGQNLERTHATRCEEADAVSASTLDRLEQVWFAPTRAEVTGAPAVTADSLYFGDWSGRIYALDRATGEERWTRDTPVQENVYAGQIPASPTVTDLDGREVVVIGSGRTVWVLDAGDGTVVWDRELGDDEGGPKGTEIQGSPAVADGMVIVPTDVHNEPTLRSGIVALSLADGEEIWRFDPEQGKPSGGCGSMWGSPSIDVEAREVVVGVGSCFSAESWTEYSEAMVGLDLDTGVPRWSYQPRAELNAQDWDFAGAPNLFTIGGSPVAGLGNKDGWYYVVDRTTGRLVWKTEAVKQVADDDGFAFGGFIGATVVSSDASGRPVVAGATAVGDCPCQHGFDAATGEALWQSPQGSGTYGASAAAPGVVFTAGVDQTLRAYDLATGEVVWDRPLQAISASGAAIAGDFMAIGVGFREPGTDAPPSGGMHGFRVLAKGEAKPTPSTTTTLPAGPAVRALQATTQECVGAPCDVGFTLKDPPAGHAPTLTYEIAADPFRFTATATDLGEPSDWTGDGGPPATVFAVFISPRDDKPELGSILCVLDDVGTCSTDLIGNTAESYTRISLVALADATTTPSLQEGYARLVTTRAFDPALVPAG